MQVSFVSVDVSFRACLYVYTPYIALLRSIYLGNTSYALFAFHTSKYSTNLFNNRYVRLKRDLGGLFRNCSRVIIGASSFHNNRMRKRFRISRYLNEDQERRH